MKKVEESTKITNLRKRLLLYIWSCQAFQLCQTCHDGISCRDALGRPEAFICNQACSCGVQGVSQEGSWFNTTLTRTAILAFSLLHVYGAGVQLLFLFKFDYFVLISVLFS